MKQLARNVAATLLGAGVAFAAGSAAATDVGPDQFVVRSAQDLVDLCSASADDEEAAAAIHFCHGFGAGAWHYYVAATSGPGADRRFVCVPDPPPSRSEALSMFVAWAKEHPAHLQEPAVEVLFRFLSEKWPCASAAAPKGGSAK